MSPRLSWLAVALLGAAEAAAQSIVVTSTADAGAGSLRAALLAANASPAATFTIDIASTATAAPIVLASFLPPLLRSNVTLRPLGGAGRLVVDGRGLGLATGYGMEFAGSNLQVLAPVRVLVSQGNGVVVRGAGVRLVDLEVQGAASSGTGVVAIAGADGLTIGSLHVQGFQQGIQLLDCSNAHIADDGTATAVFVAATGAGISITNGQGHSIGAFSCMGGEVGLAATDCPDLQLGGVGGLRASASACRQQGMRLTRCSNARIARVDLVGNGLGPSGGVGLHLIGGSRLDVRDVVCGGNTSGGMILDGGATIVRIGPGVVTLGPGGSLDIGLAVRHASAVRIADSVFGPDHWLGVAVAPGAGGLPENVTIFGCTIGGNRSAGVSVQRSLDTLLCSSTITGNLGNGVDVVGASLAVAPRRCVIANCSVSGNAGAGIHVQGADTLQVGPGNRVDGNHYTGVHVFTSATVAVRDNLSIDHNRAQGVFFVDTPDGVVARTPLRDNRGAGVYALRCAGLSVGPGVVVRDTVGVGVFLEGCIGGRVFSSQLLANTAYGMQTAPALSAPATSANVLQSCLVAGHLGIGVYHTGGAPLRLELCTIAGNLRGVFSGGNALAIDSSIVWGNVLEDLQQTATALTVARSFHQIPAPAGSSTNSNADPRFVSPAAADWRVQPTSPAVGAANVGIVVPPNSVDAYSGPRVVGAVDAGAHEVGPNSAGAAARILLSSDRMVRGGGGLAFQIRHPATAAGMVSILLLQLGPPSGSFQAFGATIPLAQTPALTLLVEDPNTMGALATVDAAGLVTGALLWSGTLPTSIQNLPMSVCAVAMDWTLTIRSVTDVATFTIQ